MTNMADGNSAALRIYEADQARGEELMDLAQAERGELVEEFIADERSKNQRELLDTLGDWAGGFPDLLRQIQRIKLSKQLRTETDKDAVIQAALMIARLFTDRVDNDYGNSLVEKRASQLEESV